MTTIAAAGERKEVADRDVLRFVHDTKGALYCINFSTLAPL
jgi:hypothetical protein